MPALLETLQLSHPSIAAEAAAEFRTALVAILQQLEQDETAANRSLQGWWTWLDEEGYDRDGFGLILNQVGEAKLGQQGQAELLSLLQANAAEPGGVPRLIDHVQSKHPALAKEIESLETLAVTEEQQLHARAGGSSAGRDTGIAVGVIGGTIATVVVVYKGKQAVNWLVSKWKNRGQGAVERVIDRDEVKGTERVEFRAEGLERQSKEKGESITKKIRTNPDIFAKDIKQNALQEDMKIGLLTRQNKISIVNYTEKHIKARVEMLVRDHLDKYGEKIIENDIKDSIRQGDDYRGKVLTIAENKSLLVESSNDLSVDTKHALEEAREEVEGGIRDDYFKDAKEALEAQKQILTENLTKELTSSYTKLVKDEVDLAKKEAIEKLSLPERNLIDEGKVAIKKSEVKVEEEVLYTARKATARAKQEAAAAAREAEKAEDLA